MSTRQSLSPSVHWGKVEVLTEPRKGRKRKTLQTTKTVLRSGLRKKWKSTDELSSSVLNEEYFERSPKTDYTYSRTGSYACTHIDDVYVSPNLSRSKLRVHSSIAVSESSSAYSSAEENQLESIRAESIRAERIHAERIHAESIHARQAANNISSQQTASYVNSSHSQLNSSQTQRNSSQTQRNSSQTRLVTETVTEETVMGGRRGQTPVRNTRMTRNNRVATPQMSTRVTRSRKETPPRVYESYSQEYTERRDGYTPVTPSPMARGDSPDGSSRRSKGKTMKHLYGLDSGSDVDEMSSDSETSTLRDVSGSNSSVYKNLILSPFRYLYQLILSVLSFDTWLISRVRACLNSMIRFPLLLVNWIKHFISSPLGGSIYPTKKPSKGILKLPSVDAFPTSPNRSNSSVRFVSGYSAIDEDTTEGDCSPGTTKFSKSSKRFNNLYFLLLLLLLPFFLGLFCNNTSITDMFYFAVSPLVGFGSFLSSICGSLATMFSRTTTIYSTEDRMMHIPPIDKLDDKVKKLILNIGQNNDRVTVGQVEGIVRKMMQEEMQQFLSRLDSETGRHMARQIQTNSDFEGRLSSQQNQLSQVSEKAQKLALDLSTARENMKLEQINQRNETFVRLFELDNALAAMRTEMLKLQTTQSDLVLNLKTCCKNESYIVNLMKRLMHEEWFTASNGAGGKADDFNFWLQKQFVSKEAFEEKFKRLAARLAKEIKDTEKSEGTQVIINTPNGTGLSEDHVRNLVQEALNVYSADKTGMVDYALESAGGSVLSTRCSETYGRTAQLTLFGFPLWFVHQSPRTVIQPDVQPGQCWAFKGTHGYVVIQLAAAIHPTSFSLEHIPKLLSPTGHIDSAPKDFSVWGLQNEKQTRGVLLGDYTYDKDGNPLQFFPVKNANAGLFPIVELKILSNHGNSDYTCLYRFRVHGVLQET